MCFPAELTRNPSQGQSKMWSQLRHEERYQGVLSASKPLSGSPLCFSIQILINLERQIPVVSDNSPSLFIASSVSVNVALRMGPGGNGVTTGAASGNA